MINSSKYAQGNGYRYGYNRDMCNLTDTMHRCNREGAIFDLCMYNREGAIFDLCMYNRESAVPLCFLFVCHVICDLCSVSMTDCPKCFMFIISKTNFS